MRGNPVVILSEAKNLAMQCDERLYTSFRVTLSDFLQGFKPERKTWHIQI